MDKPEIKNTLLYVGGDKNSFRCDCGCNVFHPVSKEELEREGYNIDLKVFECNGCNFWYVANH